MAGMKTIRGDIWDLLPTHTVIIGTNVGWDEKADPPMRNNMGAGLAMQARDRFPRLAWWYGLRCAEWWLERNDADAPGERWLAPQTWHEPKAPGGRLFLVAVKPLAADPAMSWDQPADIDWVRRGLAWVKANTTGHVALPLIGSGNGRIWPPLVREVIQQTVGDDDRFTLVLTNEKHSST